MKQALAIFRFLKACAERGEPAALVTLTDVTGSAARGVGEHMAVAASGAAVGSFSGGCVEAAVIAEAREVLTEGRARTVRYGAGSPYIDIRLPCGGGIDLLFVPDPDRCEIERAISILERRMSLVVRLSEDGSLAASEAQENDRTAWRDDVLHVRHDPPLRLVVLGHGAEPGALLDVACAYGAETMLLSPQEALVEDARQKGRPAETLRILGRSDSLTADPWTAVITLFHDHDWETDLLLQACEQNPFFIGAMGSKRTHAERRRRLIEAGGTAGQVDRVVGPVGLIHATRDPYTLAISILAQVVEAYEGILADRTNPSMALNSTHRFVERHERGNYAAEALSL